MRFESKRDAWIVLLIRGVPLLVMAAILYSWYASGRYMGGPIVGVILILLAEIFLLEWLMRSTYYEIQGDVLFIGSGIFKWRVPVREITAITPTRNPLSSPALSLDRLRIDYGSRQIMVSPEEKQRFIEALRAVNPHIFVPSAS